MKRVRERIAREKAGPGQLRYAWGWRVALALFLGLLVATGTWQRQTGRDAQRKAELQKVHADRARVAGQTAGAIGYIGHVLLEVAAQSQDSILKEAVPPLRDGLQTTKNKVIKKM